MITKDDKNILREVGIRYILDSVINSNTLKNKLTFREHVDLCKFTSQLTYEDVIPLIVSESIKEFEGKFSKFLKYGFAAIAGRIGGPLGPPLTMFALYIFRKLTDTCSRSCLDKFPLSNDRKICRYECQTAACRRIVRDLRSQISQCQKFHNPTKCEKSLQKEYIKWSRRLQQQIVKLNQAKMGREEKIRRQRQKDLQKKAKTIAASYQITKSKMLNMLAEDSRFRKIPFKQHIQLYKTISVMLEEDDHIIVKTPEIDPKKEKYARQALYLGLWVIPIPFFNDVINYIIKKHNFACYTKCLKQRKYSQKICRTQCSYLSAKYGVKILNQQLSKCNKANKPIKCKNKIFKMLEDWKQREVETKIKFNNELRYAVRSAKEREGKS